MCPITMTVGRSTLQYLNKEAASNEKNYELDYFCIYLSRMYGFRFRMPINIKHERW